MTDKLRCAALEGRALIAVAGADWRDFLQNLITQDVETLGAGEARLAALLTPQGKLLFDLFVVGREDGVWLDVAAELRDTLIQRLMLYRLRAKVTIAADAAQVSALFGAEATPGPGFVRDPRLPALGWRGYDAAAPTGAEAACEAAYDAFRLSLGVPGAADWGVEKTYPIEADFDLLGGVDFKKGCFVGQETTSRMKRRGQIKTRMLPIVFDGPPPPAGAEVLAGDLRAGEVLSGADGRAMALLRLDRALGATLVAGGKPVRVETPEWMVAHLPAADPSEAN
jgi:tRNA-modifying protein YgfZ